MQDLYTNVTFSFLRQMEQASLDNDIEAILSLGASQAQVDKVSQLRAADVFKLARVIGIIDINVDEELLDIAINRSMDHTPPSPNNPNAEMTGELLRSISRLASELDNYASLQKFIDISDQTISKIADLTLSQINNIVRSGLNFYEITANEVKMDMAIDYVIEQTSERDAISNLMKAGASWPMLNELTGMSKNAYSKMRAQLELPGRAGGAPKSISEKQSIEAYNLWQQNQSKPIIQRVLDIHKAIGVELRDLWPTINEYRQLEVKEKVS